MRECVLETGNGMKGKKSSSGGVCVYVWKRKVYPGYNTWRNGRMADRRDVVHL